MAKDRVGDKPPTLSLPDQTGKPVSLKDFTGKQVVFFFMPKTIFLAVRRSRANFAMPPCP